MKHFFVCQSGIHGLGIVAGENIKKGEFIARIKGELKFKVNKTIEDTFANPDWVGVEKNIWIDPEKPYKFLNHSCDATAGIKGKITLMAVKNIKEGEEITIDYSTIEGDENWKMSCLCSSKKCRKNVGSISKLPKDYFERYLPYVSTYFKKKYERNSNMNETTK